MNALTFVRRGSSQHEARSSRKGSIFETAGNLLMLVGLYLLLFVGGLFANEQFNVLAAQGDSNIQLPEAVAAAPQPAPTAAPPAPTAAPVAQVSAVATPIATPVVRPSPTAAAPTAEPQRYVLPRLNEVGDGRELNTLAPAASGDYGPNTITRIVIPTINVDRKVVEVGWKLQEINGQQVAVWDVAKYAVGHHKGTANPGQAGNVVMAGHSGGRAYPFNDLFYLKPGDPIIFYSGGQQYQYTVSQNLLVNETGPGVTMAQRRANARYIEPTDSAVATLIACWPLSGPLKFTQRVIIRAVPNQPVDAAQKPGIVEPTGAWSAR